VRGAGYGTNLSVPKEEKKLKLSMEYVWKAAFLTVDQLYGRYPRLLVGVHSVLATRAACDSGLCRWGCKGGSCRE
jgi:hypothetical protein